MTDWTLRIKSRMKELDMTQEMLASKMSITRGAITHYLSGRRIPPLKQFQKLAVILKVDPAWLQYGTKDSKVTIKKSSKKEKIDPTYPVRLIEWNHLANFIAKKFLADEKHRFLPNFFVDNENWFALTVKGDSMTSSLNNDKNFHEGEIIIIGQEQSAKHGDYVIALLPHTNEATFKQYVVDSGIAYLKPLNPQYPLFKVEKGTKILGVVKNKIHYF